MATVIKMIFREGLPKARAPFLPHANDSRCSLARERGLTIWRESEDLVVAAAYRVLPPVSPDDGGEKDLVKTGKKQR